MKKVIFVVFFFLFVCTSAYAGEIALGPSYQDLDISGNVKSDGTEISLKDDLGLDNDKPIGLSLRIDAEKHHFNFDYTAIDFSGSQVLTKNIEFNSKTYTATTLVESKLKYNLWELQYNYDLVGFKEENFGISLSPLLKLTFYDTNLSIVGGGYDETYSETLRVPTIGVAGQLDVTKYVSLLAQVSGITYTGDTYFEYKSVLRIKPIKYISLDLGYKGMDIDYSHSNDLIDITASGPYVQGAVVLGW